jgi:diphthine-ammonia ligase
MPLIELEISGISCKENEYNALAQAIIKAKGIYNIEGIVHGGISSRFQNRIFEKVAVENQLRVISPLWNIEPSSYMRLLVDYKFDVKIISVSAMGLDRLWLGKSIDLSSLNRLEYLSKRYGFNLTFEGGEAETLVTDCPLFKYKINIERANKRWDGQRGIFEILEVSLVPK